MLGAYHRYQQGRSRFLLRNNRRGPTILSAGDIDPRKARSLDTASRIGAWRDGGWHHHAETLQKQDGALRGASPYKLATFTLAILHINVAARIFQAAILELAIHVDAIVQHHMLILKCLVLISIHRFTRATGRFKKSHAFPRSQFHQRRTWGTQPKDMS